MSDDTIDLLDRLVQGTLRGRPNNELSQGLRRYMAGLRLRQKEARELQPQIDEWAQKEATVAANIRRIRDPVHIAAATQVLDGHRQRLFDVRTALAAVELRKTQCIIQLEALLLQAQSKESTKVHCSDGRSN
ncbi:hypothetical protein H4R19_002116 [Coemansia spiralis]|nr:hypothetical protein H4R19_002116 [Coemansia spiralis]